MGTFDPEKDAISIAKHGISLARAEEMDMSAALIREDDRLTTVKHGTSRLVTSTTRFNVTFRGSKVRAISLRKANKRESRRYGRQTEV
jgi:uncharacterized DUF497 family protein